MKIPREAIDELLGAEEVRRSQLAEERARESAAALAREVAANALLDSVVSLTSPRESPRTPRQIPVEATEVIDRTFASLARRHRSQRWEDLAGAARAQSLTDLADALDRVALASGTRDESAACIEAAVTAAISRLGKAHDEQGPCDRWSRACELLTSNSRVEAKVHLETITLTASGWIATDSFGGQMRVDPGSGLAAVMAGVESGGTDLDAIVAMNASSGFFAVPVRCRPESHESWIRLS